MYTGLAVIAFHILIIGPIKDLVKHETIFTESLQNTNGKIFEILGGYYVKYIILLFIFITRHLSFPKSNLFQTFKNNQVVRKLDFFLV